MYKILKKENMGKSDLGWLQSNFHFSFAEYRNYDNINFGVLRVLNDDIVRPNSGFDTHSHENIEIISYIVKGEISHKDSMGNEETLKRGEVQYLSAGNGIFHSEHNKNKKEDLRLLQIWIIPPKRGLPKIYGSKKYKKEERRNKLLNIVSSKKGNSQVKIYQDVNFYVSELEKNKTLFYEIKNKRQVYYLQVEGRGSINGHILEEGDAIEITKERTLAFRALEDSHFLFIEMKEE